MLEAATHARGSQYRRRRPVFIGRTSRRMLPDYDPPPPYHTRRLPSAAPPTDSREIHRNTLMPRGRVGYTKEFQSVRLFGFFRATRVLSCPCAVSLCTANHSISRFWTDYAEIPKGREWRGEKRGKENKKEEETHLNRECVMILPAG